MPNELTPKQQITELVRQAQSVLVLSHAHPDGDALGSGIALKLGLEKLDKQVTFAVSGTIPEVLSFLPHFEQVDNDFKASKDLLIIIDESQAKVGNVSLKRVSESKLMVVVTPKDGTLTTTNVRVEDGSFKTDLVIVLDCSDLDRIGSLYEENPSLFFEVPVINIDHHPTNTNFGKVNLVDVTASSASEILVGLLEMLGKDIPGMIDADMATALLTGITTDTGSFQNVNTTPKALTVAAQLVAAGAKQQEIIKRIFQTRSLAQLRLWGRALSYIKEEPAHKFAWSVLTKADYVAAQASPGEASSGVVDELFKSAEGMEFVLLMYERDGGIKGSLRAAQPQVDVSRIAASLGGGGHVQAAAFFVPDTTIADGEQKVITHIREFLSGQQPAGTSTAPLSSPAPVPIAEPSEEPVRGPILAPGAEVLRQPNRRSRPMHDTPAQDAPEDHLPTLD